MAVTTAYKTQAGLSPLSKVKNTTTTTEHKQRNKLTKKEVGGGNTQKCIQKHRPIEDGVFLAFYIHFV